MGTSGDATTQADAVTQAPLGPHGTTEAHLGPIAITQAPLGPRGCGGATITKPPHIIIRPRTGALTARSALVVCLVALCALLFVGAAQADWRSLPSPGGQIHGMEVADAHTWLLQTGPPECCGSETLEATGDGGLSWTPISIGEYADATLTGPAPDHSFRVVGLKFGSVSELQVFKVTAEGAVPLGPVIETNMEKMGTPATDDDGSTWIPIYSEADHAYELKVVGADGTTFTAALPADVSAPSWTAVHTAFGVRLVRTDAESIAHHALAGDTFKLNAQHEVVPAERFPVDFADGQVWLSTYEHASWDAGGHWTEGRFPRAVPGAPGLPRRYLTSEGKIAERYSPSLFRYTGLELPEGVLSGSLVDAGSALVAFSSSAVYVFEGSLPSLPLEVGTLPAEAKALIARADLFRADAGLPPLTADAKISQASYNHSLYTALNKGDPYLGHGEAPGKPGYTGAEPPGRCLAVGTSCNSEVIYSPVADPIAGWLATPFHRPLLGAPQAGVVGAGQAEGGWTVMDGASSTNLLIKPFGYPVGRWRGEDGFSGESPDPVAQCQARGEAISYPVGIAVSLYLPSEFASVTRIAVRKRGSADVLPGCLVSDTVTGGDIVGSLVLADPLVSGQTYDVHAEWNTGPDSLPGGVSGSGATLGEDWSFTYLPDARSPVRRKRCRAIGVRKAVPRRSRRGARRARRKGLEVAILLSDPARVRLRSARLSYRSSGHRHRNVKLPIGKLRRRNLRLGRRSLLKYSLPRRLARRLAVGKRVRLRLVFRAQRLKGCTRSKTVSVHARLNVGLVHVKRRIVWRTIRKARKRSRKGHHARHR